jgi:hypothetical protein
MIVLNVAITLNCSQKLVTKNLIEDWENVLNLFPLGE